MGKFDSTKYRVIPFVSYVKNNKERLNKFLSVFNIQIDTLPEKYYYGDNEFVIKPSKEHLIKLVEYISTKDCANLVTKNPNRKELYFGTASEREKAKNLAIKQIDESYENLPLKSKKWYVFEEYTHPDIFIEGEDYIIVGESKWTEKEITIKTKNLKPKNGEYRNQMIRHIQATLNYTDKKIYAFYIVDEIEGKGYLNELTRESFKKQISMETIKIAEEEKEKIYNCFCGYTTWQKIVNLFPELRKDFLTKEQISQLILEK